MIGIGDELLAEAQHLQRMPLDALERLRGAIDQQALGRPADAQRRACRPAARAPVLDCERQLGILGDIDVDRGDRAADDADAASGQRDHVASSSSVVARAAWRVHRG